MRRADIQKKRRNVFIQCIIIEHQLCARLSLALGKVSALEHPSVCKERESEKQRDGEEERSFKPSCTTMKKKLLV